MHLAGRTTPKAHLYAKSELGGSPRPLACARSLAVTQTLGPEAVESTSCLLSLALSTSQSQLSSSSTHTPSCRRHHFIQASAELDLFWRATSVGRACHQHLKLTLTAAHCDLQTGTRGQPSTRAAIDSCFCFPCQPHILATTFIVTTFSRFAPTTTTTTSTSTSTSRSLGHCSSAYSTF